MTRDDAKRKIEKLLATAKAGSGATDPERATAKAMAERLAQEHGFKIQPKAPQPARFTIDPGTFIYGGFDAALMDAIRRNDEEYDRIEAKRRIFAQAINRTFWIHTSNTNTTI